jgi:cytochrome P450
VTERAASPVEPADLYTEVFRADPFAVWRRLQEEQPLFHDTVADVFVLTRYEDVVAVLRDPESYSARVYAQWFAATIGSTFAELDGEEQSWRRNLIAPHLVGRPLERLAPLVRAVAAETVSELPSTGDVDLTRFTLRFPTLVTADLFELRAEERGSFVRISKAIHDGLVALDGTPDREAGIAARAELEAFTGRLLDEGRIDGALAWLTGDVGGRRLEREHVKTHVNFLLAAAGPTVDYALRNMVWALLSDSELLAAGAGDGALLDAVFTETLRFAPPVPYENRIATRDVEWHGRTVAAGSVVRVCLAAANSDETVFAEPRRFDAQRSDVRRESRGGARSGGAAAHLAFGLGSHFCLGYRLARMEAVVGVGRLLAALGRPRFAGSPPALGIHKLHLTVPTLTVTADR